MSKAGPRSIARRLATVVWLAIPAAVVGWLFRGAYHHDNFAWASAIGAVLVLLVGFLPVVGRLRLARVISCALLVIWAGGVIGWMSSKPVEKLVVQREANYWSGYHYYFGSKYFAELGFDGLYEQSLAADAEMGKNWAHVRRIRNLRNYERVGAAQWMRERNDRWTDDRWESFKTDIATIQPLMNDRLWSQVLNDRGYNAPPSFTFFHEKLGVVPPTNMGFVKLAVLDPLMLIVALVVVARVVGPVPALVAGAWLTLFFGNDSNRVFMVQGLYDYLAALILAVAALRSRRPALSGVAWAYSAMARIFPGVLLLGPAIWAARRWRRDADVRWMVKRFGVAFGATALVLFLLGGMTGRGFGAWSEFASTIGMHSDHHRFGDQRVGLQHSFTRDWSRHWGEWERKVVRYETWPRQKPLWVASAAIIGGLWFVAVWRSKRDDPHEAIVLTFGLVFAGIVLSRYYWSAACIWPLLLARDRGERFGRGAALSMAALLVLGWAFHVFAHDDKDPFGRYVLVNLVMGLGWFSVLLAYVLPWRRLRARFFPSE